MTGRSTRLAESLKVHPPAQLAAWLEEIHRIGDHRVQAKIEGWAAVEPPRVRPKLPGSLEEQINTLEGTGDPWDTDDLEEEIEQIQHAIEDEVLPQDPTLARELCEALLRRDDLLENAHDHGDPFWDRFQETLPLWARCAAASAPPEAGWGRHLVALAAADDWGVRSQVAETLAPTLSPESLQELKRSLADLLGVEPLAGKILESMAESVGETVQMEAVARAREGDAWESKMGLRIAEVALRHGRPEEAIQRAQQAAVPVDWRRTRLLQDAWTTLGRPEKVLEVLDEAFQATPGRTTFLERLKATPIESIEEFRQAAHSIAQTRCTGLARIEILLSLGDGPAAEEHLLTEPYGIASYRRVELARELVQTGGYTAAAILLQREIAEILNHGTSSRYEVARDCYLELERIELLRTRPWPKHTCDHASFVAWVASTHRRKRSFWAHLSGASAKN